METNPRSSRLPELPKRVGRYEAFLQIGAGGMADLYLGVQRGPFDAERLVAIKQLRREIAADPHRLAMFIDEARIALRLNHPNVVHSYEVLDEAPDYYLVMEYLDGHSLLDVLSRIERTNMPLHEHIWILTQMLAGLHYAHTVCDFDGTPLGIVHRDVSPSNVFVCRDGAVKLLDFGIAKVQGTATQNQPGILNGKLSYIAPEVCLGEPATVRSDVYAVGVMLWEAMARRRRISGETPAARVKARIRGSEPPIERVWPDAPRPLAAIVRRALDRRPERRHESARALELELREFLLAEQSEAGAASLSRLLQPYFERDRLALAHAIESYVGAEREPDPTSVYVPVTRSGILRTTDDDARTSPVPIDPELLMASTPRVAWSPGVSRLQEGARKAAAYLRVLYGALVARLPLKRHRSAVLVAAVAFACVLALAGWLASSARREAPPQASAPVDRDAGLISDQRAATTAPPVRIEPVAQPASPAPPAEPIDPVVEQADPETASAAPAPRASWKSSKAKPTRTARSRSNRDSYPPLGGSVDPAQIEPGMDFPVVARGHSQPTIDQEDPYP